MHLVLTPSLLCLLLYLRTFFDENDIVEFETLSFAHIGDVFILNCPHPLTYLHLKFVILG